MTVSAAFSRSTSACCSRAGTAGGASIADRRSRTARSASRSVRSSAAARVVHALDQLLDALHLLLERALGGGALLVLAVTDPACRPRRTGRDRLVEPVGLRGERLPLVDDGAPGGLALRALGRAVVRRRQAVGFERQLAEPGVNPLERLAVLVTLRRAPARLLEARAQLGVLALLRGRTPACLPTRRAPSRARRAYRRRAARRRARRCATNAARRAAARSASARRSASSRSSRLDRARARRRASRRTALPASASAVSCRAPRHCAAASSSCARRPRHRGARGDRVERAPCTSRDALLPLLERGLPGRLGVVHFLDHGACALGDRLVLRARRRGRRAARDARRPTSSPRRRVRAR